jgi:hypothetical protein
MQNNQNLNALLAIADTYLSSRVVEHPLTDGERACANALDAVVKARGLLKEAAHAQQEAAPAEVTKSQERDYNWLLRLAKSKGYQTVYGALYAAPTTVPDHSEREAANAGGLTLQQLADRIGGHGVMSPREFRAFLNGDGVEMYPHQLLHMVNMFAHQSPAANAKDAARWRAFVGSSRIRPLGSAGLSDPMPGNYAHMGLEVWTAGDWGDASTELGARLAAQTKLGAEWLTKYADIAIDAQSAAMAAVGAARQEGGNHG